MCLKLLTKPTPKVNWKMEEEEKEKGKGGGWKSCREEEKGGGNSREMGFGKVSEFRLI